MRREVNFTGGPEGAIPTPVESIQEFRVSTSNHSASFSGSSGSETVLVTKRGSNTYHGSAYWFLQNDNLNANTWDRNRLGQARPESKDNRFGLSLGGYVSRLPEAAKTYFYMNYEGRRLVASTQVSRLVPSDSLRQGILRFRDAAGNVRRCQTAGVIGTVSVSIRKGHGTRTAWAAGCHACKQEGATHATALKPRSTGSRPCGMSLG